MYSLHYRLQLRYCVKQLVSCLGLSHSNSEYLLSIRVVREELMQERSVALGAAGGQSGGESGGARAGCWRVREAKQPPAHAHAARLLVGGRREQLQLLSRAEPQPEPGAPRAHVCAECVQSTARN